MYLSLDREVLSVFLHTAMKNFLKSMLTVLFFNSFISRFINKILQFIDSSVFTFSHKILSVIRRIIWKFIKIDICTLEKFLQHLSAATVFMVVTTTLLKLTLLWAVSCALPDVFGYKSRSHYLSKFKKGQIGNFKLLTIVQLISVVLLTTNF